MYLKTRAQGRCFMGRQNGKNPERGTPKGRCYCRSTLKRLIEYPSAPPMKTSDKK